MTQLNTNTRLDQHDELFQMLINLHQNLSQDASNKANAKLILLLANHIGDIKVVAEAINLVLVGQNPDH